MRRQRDRRAALKQDRLCQVCGLRCDAGHVYCACCRRDRSAKNRHLARAGICINCRRDSDRPGKVLCAQCAAKRNTTQRRAYAEGRVRVRATPRGKQVAWRPDKAPLQTPVSAKVALPQAGSLALSLFGYEVRK